MELPGDGYIDRNEFDFKVKESTFGQMLPKFSVEVLEKRNQPYVTFNGDNNAFAHFNPVLINTYNNFTN